MPRNLHKRFLCWWHVLTASQMKFRFQMAFFKRGHVELRGRDLIVGTKWHMFSWSLYGLHEFSGQLPSFEEHRWSILQLSCEGIRMPRRKHDGWSRVDVLLSAHIMFFYAWLGWLYHDIPFWCWRKASPYQLQQGINRMAFMGHVDIPRRKPRSLGGNKHSETQMALLACGWEA